MDAPPVWVVFLLMALALVGFVDAFVWIANLISHLQYVP